MVRPWVAWVRRFHNRHFLTVDLGAAAGATLALRLAASHAPAIRWFWSAMSSPSSSSLYGTLAGVTGTLLGFVITGLSVILALGQQPQFQILRESGQIRTVWRIYMETIAWLAGATVWSLTGMLLLEGGGASGQTASLVETALIAITGMRLYRCVWVLKEMLEIVLLSVSGHPEP